MKSKIILVEISLLLFICLTNFAQSSEVLDIEKPGLKERIALAGVKQLPPVSSRHIKLTPAQQKFYSERYKNFKFKDESRYVKGNVLGVTGLYAMDSTKRQDLFVYYLDEKSPAQGLVKVNDIIVGVNGRLFEDFRDCRIVMGLSITESQTTDLKGKLYLHLMRDGNFGTVQINIGTEIPYSETFPFNCERSKKMAAQHIKLIKKTFKPHASATADWWNILMLLASDDIEAQMLARRVIYELKEPKIKRLSTWYLGYELIMLSEYYLLTGDATILESIKKYKKIVEDAQCPSGGWAHGLGPGGYGGTGEVNATGLTCLMGLVLAEKCGVEMNRERYEKSINYFKRFRVGTIPYGNHPPKKYDGANNGKAGMAAVIFDLLGDKETSRMFAIPSCYSYDFREGGHAEGLFNFAWGPLGAMHASPEEYKLFMNNQLWYYELGRKMNDSYTYFRGGRFLGGMRLGGMGLFLMMPGKKLQILGAEPSVFSIKPPKGAEKAARLYQQKEWRLFLEECKQVKGEQAVSYAKRLYETFETMKKEASFTIAHIQKNLSGKSILESKKDYIALEGMLGANWPGLADLKKKVDSAYDSMDPDDKKRGRQRSKHKPIPKFPKGYKSTRDKRKVVLNGWTPGTDAVAEEISQKMKNMPALEVIRHAAHPHEAFTIAACKQILLREKECRPLIEELLKHKDPEYRAIAVRMMGAFEKGSLDKTRWSRNVRNAAKRKKVDAELRRSIEMVMPLAEDQSEEVQQAVANYLNAIAVLDEAVNQMFIKLSNTKHLEVVITLMNDVPYLVESHDSQFKIAMNILNNSKNFSNSSIREALQIIGRLRDYDLSPHLNDILKYLGETELYRNASPWTTSYCKSIEMLQNYASNSEVKKNIPLLCKFYVRKHVANPEIRNLFAKMDKKYVASAIRSYLVKEKQWLDNIIKNDPKQFKSHCFKEEYSRACLKELALLADDLEKGNKIDHAKYDEWAVKLKFGVLANKRGEFINAGKKRK